MPARALASTVWKIRRSRKPGEMYGAAAELDHDEHVEPAQEDDVDVGEDREDRVGQRGQELQVGPNRRGGVVPAHPTGVWLTQQARNLLTDLGQPRRSIPIAPQHGITPFHQGHRRVHIAGITAHLTGTLVTNRPATC